MAMEDDAAWMMENLTHSLYWGVLGFVLFADGVRAHCGRPCFLRPIMRAHNPSPVFAQILAGFQTVLGFGVFWSSLEALFWLQDQDVVMAWACLRVIIGVLAIADGMLAYRQRRCLLRLVTYGCQLTPVRAKVMGSVEQFFGLFIILKTLLLFL